MIGIVIVIFSRTLKIFHEQMKKELLQLKLKWKLLSSSLSVQIHFLHFYPVHQNLIGL